MKVRGAIGEAPQDPGADTRLAWIIVGVGAVVTLVLAVLLVGALRGPAPRWAAEQARRAQAAARPDRDTLPGLRGTPPDDTATPIGAVADWVEPGDYPIGALRRSEEGRVRVTLAIDAGGHATGCSVALSSGFSSLDNGTCLALMRSGRFDRARPGGTGSHDGEMRRWTSPPIRWQLPD